MKSYSVESIYNFINSRHSNNKNLRFTWLGQAGFAFKFGNTFLIIDPYLSDYLSEKYKGTIFPHTRLMDPPIKPEEILKVDYILSTHPHSDHMDPQTLSIILRNNPNCNFIIPGPEIKEAVERGINKSQIIPAFSNHIIKLKPDIDIIPIPAKHEEFKVNEEGEHSFLGYIFRFGDKILYHSGDSIPYTGLVDQLRKYKVKIALMPINGRDKFRLKNNIAGNFTIKEVLNICENVNIQLLVVHHFGMFAYNTVTEKDIQYLRNYKSSTLQILIPEVKYIYSF